MGAQAHKRQALYVWKTIQPQKADFIDNRMFNNARNDQFINLSETFLEACAENDQQKVRACLDLGVDVNSKDLGNDDWFGLLYAANHNYIELCEILLGQPGIDVNQTSNSGYTALM